MLARIIRRWYPSAICPEIDPTIKNILSNEGKLLQ